MRKKRLKFVEALLAPGMMSAACEKKQQAAAAPPDVEVVQVEQKDVPVTREWVATLNGLVKTQIRPQVKGFTVKQKSTNGAFVKAGAPPFQIGPRPLLTALDQASSNIQQAKTSNESFRAEVESAKLNVNFTQIVSPVGERVREVGKWPTDELAFDHRQGGREPARNC
jgi:multidrug efflux pump subunit AcrA (membrane-fusion protein)